jgi:predicted ATPase/class 3 adenylate cyclase
LVSKASMAGLPFTSRHPERRQLTVMFYDLVDSTVMAERLDPEDLLECINQFHRCVSDVAARLKGFVAQYLGDGGLVFFGYPTAAEDSVECAICAGLEVVQAVGDLPLTLWGRPRVRVGIATGTVVVGNLEGPGQLSGLAGETPNLAARMQSIAEPNMVVIDDQTRRLAGRLFEYRNLGLTRLKGFAQPLQSWQAVRASQTISRFDARRDSDSATPLVGRRKELAVLLNCWRRARLGHGQIVLISGDAGIGKSHLTAVVMHRLRSVRKSGLKYFCSARQQDSPLDPFIRYIERAAAFERNDSFSQKREKALLALRVEGQQPDNLSLIADLVAPAEDAESTTMDLPPEQRRRKTIDALVAQIELLSVIRPLLIVFEDVHWIDPSSQEVLALAVERIAKLPVLVMITHRQRFEPSWRKQPHVRSISLNPLPRGDAVALVRTIAADALSDRVIQDIVDRADGVPLFLEELTRTVKTGGADLRRVDDASLQSQAGAVPAALQTSLLARLDRLGTAKTVAQIAAVMGRDFSYEILAAVARDRHGTLASDLDRLVEGGVVTRSRTGSNYHFRHVLLRDAAYSTLLRDARVALHQRIALVLEGEFPEVAVQRPEVLAHHCSEARLPEKSARYWLQAGQQALAQSALIEAVSRLRRGLDVVKTIPLEAIRERLAFKLELALGPALIASKGYTAAETIESYARARELCARLNRPYELNSVLHGQWMQALMGNKMVRARQLSDDLLKLSEERQELYWIWQARYACGVTGFPVGDFPLARDHLEAAVGLYQEARDAVLAARDVAARVLRVLNLDEGHIIVLVYLSYVLLYLGRCAEARRTSDDAVAMARRFARAYPLSHALNGAAFVQLTLGDFATSTRYLDELDAVLEQHAIVYYKPMSLIWRGYCLATLGETRAGLPMIKAGLMAYHGANVHLYVPAFLRFQAEAHRAAGEIDEGLACVEQAEKLMRSSQAFGDEPQMHQARGLLLLDLGKGDEAERSLVTAVSSARASGAKLWELRATTELARVWASQGKHAEACDRLAEICAFFPNSGQPAAPARELLAELDKDKRRISLVASSRKIRGEGHLRVVKF